jgi:hypothetical protein
VVSGEERTHIDFHHGLRECVTNGNVLTGARINAICSLLPAGDTSLDTCRTSRDAVSCKTANSMYAICYQAPCTAGY